MNSPFPGIDPYIEAQGYWPDFHSAFLNACRDALDDRLPDLYAARLEEHVHLVRSSDETSTIRPDIAVVRGPGFAAGYPDRGPAVATLEPVTVALETSDLEEVIDRWIEIRKAPDLSLVTVIELLSPTNKAGDGRQEYLERRRKLIERPVHLVELDFLLGGRRLPMRRPLPPGDAHAIVSRAERRPDADVYSWTLRDRLPTIPIPLAAPDPDIPLDLAPAGSYAYRRGRYPLMLRYEMPFPLAIDPDGLAWIEATANENRG